MAHQNDYTVADAIAENRLVAIPELIRVLINSAIQVKRSSTYSLSDGSVQKTAKAKLTGSNPRL
jgi:hypothetical protein